MAGHSCLIRNPAAIRPWQFVLEPLRGYLMLAEHLANGGSAYATAWNFGPAETDANPVAWIADELMRRWGGKARWTTDSAVHPHEAHALKLDVSKAKVGLGWHPVLPLDRALGWIVEWYRAFQTGADLRRTTEEQIERYQELAGMDSCVVAVQASFVEKK